MAQADRQGQLTHREGYAVSKLSDSESREWVTRWLIRAPDHTLYHLGPCIDFASAQNRGADVFPSDIEQGASDRRLQVPVRR